MTRTHCKMCRRELWDGGNAISIDQCTSPGNETCILSTSQNNLVAALKSLIPLVNVATPNDTQILRTALAIVEQVRPSSRSCPKCAKVLVVKGTTIQPHYANQADEKTCEASFRTVLGGILL